MMELVTGGSGSGKSAYAEEKLCGILRGRRRETGKVRPEEESSAEYGEQPPLYYIATMPPWDKEAERKIEKHRGARFGRGFVTLEWYTDFAGKLNSADCPIRPGSDVLVECLSNLTANEMYMEEGAGRGAAEAVIRGITALKHRCRHLVVVTNDVFAESAETSPDMVEYKETLGRINRALAEEADRVTEVARGVPCRVKPDKEDPAGESPVRGKSAAHGVKIVTGGAFQGKLDFAKRLYPGMEWTDGKRCALEAISRCRAVYDFQEFVKRWLKAGKGWEELAARILEENADLILVCDEIGCGLVPVEAFEREYRECTGRIMVRLAARSLRIDRVVCGISTRIR